MRQLFLVIALSVFALQLGAQTTPVQKSTKPTVQPTKPAVAPKTKVKPELIKPLDPSLTQPANADSLAAAEALRRAYAWISPFRNYGMIPMEQIAHLKTLDLSAGNLAVEGAARSTYFSDDSLVHLLAFKELELLVVPRSMTDKGLATVVQLPALQKLYLGDSKITSNGFAALPAQPNITTLVMFGTAVDNTFMNTIGTQFPNLEVLNIGGTGVNDAGLAAMPVFSNLHNLILARGNFTDACIPDILKQPSLQLVSVEFTQITAAGKQQIKDHFPGITVIPD